MSQDLTKRLEAATEPDYSGKLDDMIFAWENGWSYPLFGAAISDRDYKSKEYNINFTSSIDAAVALAERVLPEWKWGLHHHRGLIRSYVVKNSPLRPMPIIADHIHPAIALCIAILKAKEAQDAR